MSRSLFIRAVTTGFIFAAFILSLVISIPVIQGLYIIQIGLHFPGQASNYSNLTDIHVSLAWPRTSLIDFLPHIPSLVSGEDI